MKVYIASYYESYYQKQRIEDFVKRREAVVINPDFGKRDKIDSTLTDEDCSEQILGHADQAWVILPGVLYNMFFYAIYKREKLARKLKISVRYFRINQRGQYVGKVREVKREEIAAPEEGFCGFTDWRRLWGLE